MLRPGGGGCLPAGLRGKSGLVWYSGSVPALASIAPELPDGSHALARDHGGSGPPILIVHGGFDDGSSGRPRAAWSRSTPLSPSRRCGALRLLSPPAVSAGASDDSYQRAREALAEPGKMMQIFIAGSPAEMRLCCDRIAAHLEGTPARVPGCPILTGSSRAGSYVIETPTRSAASAARLTWCAPRTLADTMPQAEMLIMPGRDHNANSRSPGDVARAIATFAVKVQGGREASAG